MSVALAACQPGANLRPLPTLSDNDYKLGVDDQIRIVTFGQEQITGQFRVNDRGAVAIPLLGSVQASGRTTVELERNVEQLLKEKNILIAPNVAVEVLSYRPVFVLGEVLKPGQYPYQPNMTVLTAVAIAGGFTYRARTDYASVLRAEPEGPVEGKAPREMSVRPGDVIDVLERYF
jgi:polysaccharide export outer membrane protein